MSKFLSEFLTFMLQPPVLVLFCLAVVGLSDMLSRRQDRLFNVEMEWRAREAFWRKAVKADSAMIQRAKAEFFKRKGVKAKVKVEEVRQ